MIECFGCVLQKTDDEWHQIGILCPAPNKGLIDQRPKTIIAAIGTEGASQNGVSLAQSGSRADDVFVGGKDQAVGKEIVLANLLCVAAHDESGQPIFDERCATYKVDLPVERFEKPQNGQRPSIQ